MAQASDVAWWSEGTRLVLRFADDLVCDHRRLHNEPQRLGDAVPRHISPVTTGRRRNMCAMEAVFGRLEYDHLDRQDLDVMRWNRGT
jgi:hypothetical protein